MAECQIPAIGSSAVPGGFPLQLGIFPGCDLVPQVPQWLVKEMFLTLLQDLDRRAHGSHYVASDDALRQLEVMVAEELYALIEVQHLLGNLVQAKEFLVPAVDIVDGDSVSPDLCEESVAEPRANVQQGHKSRRIEPTTMPQAGANDVVIVRRDAFQDVQQPDM